MGLGARFVDSHLVIPRAWNVFGFFEFGSEKLMALKFAAEKG